MWKTDEKKNEMEQIESLIRVHYDPNDRYNAFDIPSQSG